MMMTMKAPQMMNHPTTKKQLCFLSCSEEPNAVVFQPKTISLPST